MTELLRLMKMLITMAGKGSRFNEVGISTPKHEIPVRERSMFEWAMKSLEDFFDEEFIFVTQSTDNATGFLEDKCDLLGIKNYNEVKLTEYTDGQASTAVEADDLIRGDEEVAIYNIDTYIEPGELTKDNIRGDGYIPTFTAPGSRWSFVQTSSESNQVTKVSEKEKISDKATAGFYYFRRWDDLINAYESHANDVEDNYGETYVAPHYNYLINSGLDVYNDRIEANAVHVLGTPKDLEQFDSGFNPSTL